MLYPGQVKEVLVRIMSEAAFCGCKSRNKSRFGAQGFNCNTAGELSEAVGFPNAVRSTCHMYSC